MVEGRLDRPVFSGAREVLPAGTRVQLTVRGTKKVRTESRGLLRRGVAIATGEPRPKPTYHVAVESATVTLPDGKAIATEAEVLSMVGQRRLSTARGEVARGEVAPSALTAARSTVVVRISRGIDMQAPMAAPLPAGTELAAGTRARVMLLTGLSASGSTQRQPVEARLLEPITIREGVVIPAGSRFEGIVSARQGPRRLYRAGKLQLSFNRLIMPGGAATPVSTVLAGAEVEKGAGASIDQEGAVSGGPASKARLAINIGVAYASGKIIDDLLEEGIKWGWGAAASGTGATVARYVGLGTGLVFLALQHGNDVRLPQYTELDLTFTRPMTIQ